MSTITLQLAEYSRYTGVRGEKRWIASANIAGMSVGEPGITPLDAMTNLAEKLACALIGLNAAVNKPDPDEKMHKAET